MLLYMRTNLCFVLELSSSTPHEELTFVVSLSNPRIYEQIFILNFSLKNDLRILHIIKYYSDHAYTSLNPIQRVSQNAYK